VAHAAGSEMTEQPSFYVILCGGKEGRNVVGKDKCIFHASNVGVNSEADGRGELVGRSLPDLRTFIDSSKNLLLVNCKLIFWIAKFFLTVPLIAIGIKKTFMKLNLRLVG